MKPKTLNLTGRLGPAGLGQAGQEQDSARATSYGVERLGIVSSAEPTPDQPHSAEAAEQGPDQTASANELPGLVDGADQAPAPEPDQPQEPQAQTGGDEPDPYQRQPEQGPHIQPHEPPRAFWRGRSRRALLVMGGAAGTAAALVVLALVKAFTGGPVQQATAGPQTPAATVAKDAVPPVTATQPAMPARTPRPPATDNDQRFHPTDETNSSAPRTAAAPPSVLGALGVSIAEGIRQLSRVASRQATSAAAGIAPAPPAPGAPEAATQPTSQAPPVNIGALASPGNLRLSAILRGLGGPVAIINNTSARVGSTVAGAKVIAIGEFSVEVEMDGRRFRLGVSSDD